MWLKVYSTKPQQQHAMEHNDAQPLHNHEMTWLCVGQDTARAPTIRRSFCTIVFLSCDNLSQLGNHKNKYLFTQSICLGLS